MKRSAKKSRESSAKNDQNKGEKPERTQQKPLMVLPAGFYAIPLVRRRVLEPFDSYIKHLFVKARQEDETVTLIVSNVSVDDTEDSLRELFESLSGLAVASVDIGKDRLAIVRIEGVAQFEERFLRNITREQCLALGPSSGERNKRMTDVWLAEYKQDRPDRATIGREADEKMSEIEQRERELEEQLRQPQVDEDGFVMVVPKNKKPVKPKPATPINDLNRNQKKKTKKRIMDENLSFYRFERKRLRQMENAKLKSQIKTDLRKADRIKMELSNNAAS